MDRPCLSRRSALGALTLGTSAAALTGCGTRQDSFDTDPPVRAEDDAIPLSEIPENATTLVNFGGQQPFVAIVRGTGEDIRAMSGYCTHQGCALAPAPDADELDCPCHGSRFTADTGEVLIGPASAPLPPIEVVIEGDMLRRVR